MAKKNDITLKEFKEILKQSHYDFDIYGYGGILNAFASLLFDTSDLKQYEAKETDNEESKQLKYEVSRIYKEQAFRIIDNLLEKGYYNKD